MSHELLNHTQEIATLQSSDRIAPVSLDGGFLHADDHEARRKKRQRPYLECGFVTYEGDYEQKCLGLETPIDEETGLPLMMIPVKPPNGRANSTFVDYHHPFHARALFVGDKDLRALRMSYGEDKPRWLHEHYHAFFAGPKLPSTRQGIFKASVLACANVVPRQGIDFSGYDGPSLRDATNEEYKGMVKAAHREALRRRDGGRYQRNTIGRFFADYAVDQAVDAVVSDKVIDEFLFTTDKLKRVQLGNFILDQAVDISVDPVRPLFTSLRRQKIVTPAMSEPHAIINAYFTPARRFDYHAALLDLFDAA